jgi:hypothetical protein
VAVLLLASLVFLDLVFDDVFGVGNLALYVAVFFGASFPWLVILQKG